jgi:excisionase family DNA binding protein
VRETLSPKQVAQALGVSESSLKRWCDKGLLTTTRTPGGHRRLPSEAVVRFVRETGHPVPQPELLGLPSNVGQGTPTWERSCQLLSQALTEGNEEQCRRIVFDLYLNGHTARDIGDRVVARAFHRIGHLWHTGAIEVYRERRGCEIILRALHELRAVIPQAPTTAPVAIGGTLSGDEYKIPSTLVEIALREAGWQAESYGNSIPAATWLAALQDVQPRLLWLSVSAIADVEAFLADYDQVYREAASRRTAVAVGGRALDDGVRSRMRFSAYCENLQQLADFAATLYGPPAAELTRPVSEA